MDSNQSNYVYNCTKIYKNNYPINVDVDSICDELYNIAGNRASFEDIMKRDLAKLGTGNVKNTSEKLSDVTVYEIKNLDNGTIKYYFNKFNRTFKMESQHYKDTAKEKADVSYMIKGLSIDYKVKTS